MSAWSAETDAERNGASLWETRNLPLGKWARAVTPSAWPLRRTSALACTKLSNWHGDSATTL